MEISLAGSHQFELPTSKLEELSEPVVRHENRVCRCSLKISYSLNQQLHRRLPVLQNDRIAVYYDSRSDLETLRGSHAFIREKIAKEIAGKIIVVV